MDKALVLFAADENFRRELPKALPGYTILFNEGEDTGNISAEEAGDITVIFGSPKPDFIKKCPRLKWVQLQSAGTDGYCNGELGPGVLLSCATGVYGHGVSEHMVAATLQVLKKLHLYRDEQNRERWQFRGQVWSILGSTVLVLGLGDIGAGYAWRMKALGAHVIGIRRTPQPKPEGVDELYLQDKLDELLPRADILALALPGVKETQGIISRARLAGMKKGAVIVNGGRGSAIDTEALCDALESGHIFAAALDVTSPEPLPAGHRLWKLEGAVITPHIAGGRNMYETGQYMTKLNLENAARFVKGESLASLVDFKTGYRIPG
ncbi:MAG: D-2-hydroxyacid dehydrogenase [Treponema sp.]|jgi:phosphoglycerate dehydrogenase-like enzyme|nr:D-2-hydroxyacid dehydrogenase [Treponema sp.]